MDLGDRTSRYCMLDDDGQVLRESSVGTNKKAITQVFAQLGRCRGASSRKDDRLDAQTLARLARVDPQLCKERTASWGVGDRIRI